MTEEPINILLVEDNPGDARLFQELLKDAPFETFLVETVERLSDVPAALTDEAWDVVVLDLTLPDSAGLDTLDQVLALDYRVPIVVMTGVNDAQLGIEAVKRGAQDYLVKGEVGSNLLARSLRHAMERYQLEAAEREQRRIAEALRHIAAALNSTLDVEEVLDLILANIERIAPYDAATIMLLDGEQTARIVRANGYEPRKHEVILTYEFDIQQIPNLREIVSLAQFLVIPDVTLYDGWQVLMQEDWQRSYLGAPIRVEGRIIGIINITSAVPGFYNEAHGQNVQALADQAALAINNARHYDSQKRYSEHLQQEVTKATAQIQRSKEQIETILDNIPDPVLVLDKTGRIQLTNPAFHEQFLYAARDAQDQMPATLISHADWKPLHDNIKQVLETGETRRLELTAWRKDGSTFDADLALAHVTQSDGTSGVVISLRDISALKEVERMKDLFVSTAAHELRTPLTSIQGFSEILLTRDIDAERGERYLTFINEQATQLEAIINDLLDLSRLEAGRDLEVKVTDKLDMAQIVEDVVGPLMETAPEHRFVIKGLDDLPSVQGDRFRLIQVLRNLITNAVKYSPDGGTVTISGELAGNQIRISVADEGIGLTREQQAHIFERFYRVNNYETGGTGLGLTISKQIVERHGGTLSFESLFGEGSTFTFTLPLSANNSNRASEKAAE